MFVVVGKNENNFDIKDTTDGVVETYSSSQISKILNLGIKIQGFSIKDGKLTYKDLISDIAITKRKFITGYDTIIFNETDNWSTAREKILAAEEGSKIYVINHSNITRMVRMFCECKASEIDLSNFDTSNVINMEAMFRYCEATKIDVTNFDTSNVTDMTCMFNGCSNIKSLDISGFDTSKVVMMAGMFADCKSLISLDVSNFNTSRVTNMVDMFMNCNSLTSLDVSNFDTSKVNNMEGMFRYCDSLTSLDISNFNVSYVTKIDDMFINCNFKPILPKTGKLFHYYT